MERYTTIPVPIRNDQDHAYMTIAPNLLLRVQAPIAREVIRIGNSPATALPFLQGEFNGHTMLMPKADLVSLLIGLSQDATCDATRSSMNFLACTMINSPYTHLWVAEAA